MRQHVSISMMTALILTLKRVRLSCTVFTFFGCNNGSFDADEGDTILPAWFEGFTGSTTDVDPQLTGWVPAAGSPALSTWQTGRCILRGCRLCWRSRRH